MSRIEVLVATTSPDVKAEVIAESVAARPDMNLVVPQPVAADDVVAFLRTLPPSSPCGVVLVGPPLSTIALEQRWFAIRQDLVAIFVDVANDIVRMAVRDPGLDSVLTALRNLVERGTTNGQHRVARMRLTTTESDAAEGLARPGAPRRPLLEAGIAWVHQTLRDAIDRVPDGNGDVHGLSVTRATLLQSLDAAVEPEADRHRRHPRSADDVLDRELAAAEPAAEPLATVKLVCRLDPLEFRLMLLALAPELDLRFQRAIGFLLDDMSRRSGTLGLYATLLGSTPEVRAAIAGAGAFARWPIFEDVAGRPAAADDPLRLDAYLAQWLIGETDALASDPRVRRVVRSISWPGAGLLQRRDQRRRAAGLLDRIHGANVSCWLLLIGADSAGWRAWLELGAIVRCTSLLRVEAARFTGMDLVDIEEAARRLGRLSRLTSRPIAIDMTRVANGDAEDDGLRVVLSTLDRQGARSGIIGADEARFVRLLGLAPFETIHEAAVPAEDRVAAMRVAASDADLYLTEREAEGLATRYPLDLADLDHAMLLARSRPKNFDVNDPALARFTSACKEVATEGISHFADRIEPLFDLDDVVLPADRKEQLTEIVDNVRFSARVLDGWKFGDQLPYGRGVTALFAGASGTGKTMSAIGVARRLGVPILRLDLSRVVSKYIGDTEKALDRVFGDAERSGSAILIDEAEALLGKRSEVKDAHDRYANIEVAFLLQRMEAYRGLAILTTNMRQSLDPAFLRRLRFIIDFPRPDADAREQIWRLCLPAGSHVLDDVAIRLLARRIDLTGGHIRQITLRAAFLAAAAETEIHLEHIARAAGAELAKLGMPAIEIDVKASGKQAA